MSAGGKSSASAQSRVTLNGVEVHPTTLQPLTAVPLGSKKHSPTPAKPAPLRPVGTHFAEFAHHYLDGRHKPGNGQGAMCTAALVAVFWNTGNDIKGDSPDAKLETARALLSAYTRLAHDADADSWSVKQA